jgi:hypothetical protein
MPFRFTVVHAQPVATDISSILQAPTQAYSQTLPADGRITEPDMLASVAAIMKEQGIDLVNVQSMHIEFFAR